MIKPIFNGFLLYLAFEAWVTFLSVLEVANENMFLAIQGIVVPLVIMGATLALAFLVVIVPWEWLEEAL